MPMRRVALFVFLAALSMPAFAQQPATAVFTPNPAPQGTNVRMAFTILAPICGSPVVTGVTRTGSTIRVDYVIVLEPGFICIGVPPPVSEMELDIGGFPPGQYVVTAFGFDPGFPQSTIPPVSGTLGVLATTNVPAMSGRTTVLLALSALLAGLAWLARFAAKRRA